MNNAQKKLNIVISALETAGYNPYAQLTGYMTTGDAAYITRFGGAQELIHQVDRGVIGSYLANNGQMHLG